MKGRHAGRRRATAAALIWAIWARVAAAQVAEDIRDIRGPYLPKWGWPALAAGVLLIASGLYGFWRWRRKRAARVLLPHEIALRRLEEIGAQLQPARAREFSIAISDVVRLYIEQRFSVTATRRTTEEFLHDLLKSFGRCARPASRAARRIFASMRFRKIRRPVAHPTEHGVAAAKCARIRSSNGHDA